MVRNIDGCVAAALAALPAGVGERFAKSPLQVMREELGLTVQPAEHLSERREAGGLCDGVSYLIDDVILYRSTGNRRENFTVAHELGHWLVDKVEEIYDWLAGQENAETLLETICDRIGQALLIPKAAVDRVLRGGQVSARQVGDLVASTHASRPACAIALAGRLPGTGAVVVIDRIRRVVQYSSVQPDPIEGWPSAIPWPGQPLPAGHPLHNVRRGQEFGRKTYWLTPWGARQEYYVNAVADDWRVIAVFADRDLWHVETLHIDEEREFVQRPESEFRCCGKLQRTRGYPCSDCGRHYCPECHACLCDERAARETTCRACGLEKQAHLLDEQGVCVDCI